MTAGWMKRGRENGTTWFCFPSDLRVEWCAWNRACNLHASLPPLTLHPHVWGGCGETFLGKTATGLTHIGREVVSLGK